MAKTNSKKAQAKSAKRGSKKMSDDFIGTLDSDEEEQVVLEDSDNEKVGGSDNENEDMNPDFQFAFDDSSLKFSGWDFAIGETESTKKGVDLDKILKQKGGLVNLVGVDNKSSNEKEEDEQKDAEDNRISEDAEEEYDDSEGDNESDDGEEQENSDVDELALDGFGMGVEEREDEDGEEEENVEEEAKESEVEKEEQNNQLEEMSSQSDNEEKDDEDSAEAIAKFYDSNSSKTSSIEKFASLQLSRPVLKALANLGYTKPSPIQASSIPIALMGKDIVAGAVTGSGKTAAYMIPIIERLLYKPSKTLATRVIVLAPTRELAIQVCDVGRKIASFIPTITFGLAVGGLNLRQQEQQLKSRPDIVIATPGRLIDHIRNSASFSIDSLEILVMDEADRMLDEGFQAELTEILFLIPKHKRQTMLFSATMNTKIQDLIQLSLQKPVRIMIDPPKTASNNLIQEFVRIRKRDHLKAALLYQLLRDSTNAMSRTVVFVSRKETAHRLRIVLGLLGLKVSELHGGLTQEQRLENVTDFKNLTVPILVCTDLAARGLDIPKIELVVNYDMPKTYEIYLHRVGRTARAGRDGRSITFVGESSHDRSIIKDAIKSLNDSESPTKGKALSRSVDWKEVEELNKIVETKADTIEEVIEEEKHAKEILSMEMELNKASNLIKHKNEIESRPKRTWFQTEQEKKGAMHNLTKHGKKVNSKKRKAIEARKEIARPFKKTKQDRLAPVKKVKNKKKGKK